MDYITLNIDRDASNTEIKKAYYSLAKKYHPDRNPGFEDKFKEINNAYENIIKGKSKNEQSFFYYFSTTSLSPEINDIIQKFMTSEKGRNIYEKINKISELIKTGIPQNFVQEVFNYRQFHTQKHNNFKCKKVKTKGDDTIITVNIKLEDIFNNVEKEISLTLTRKCNTCNGNGYTNKNNTKKLCNTCNGTLYSKTNVNFKFFSNNDKIVFENSGNHSLDKSPGDLLIYINPKPHIYFKYINDNDLMVIENISIWEVYNGYSFYLNHLDGGKYFINYNKPIKNNIIKRIKNLGMSNNQINGDLFIKFNIIIPNINENTLDYINSLNLTIKRNNIFDNIENDFEKAEIIEANRI